MADIGKVTLASVEANRDDPTSVRMLQVQITDDTDVQGAQLMQPAGVDSCPVAGSMVILIPCGSAWKIAVAADDGLTPAVEQGEIKIYAQAGGRIVASVYCKLDGTITTANDAGTMSLLPSGQLDVNGNFTVDP